MIPEEKQAVVERALQQAFGVTEIEDIRLLAGGMSTAKVYRVVVQGKPYLLRIIMRTDAMGDPTRQIGTMGQAAEAGIAPQVWYASIEDRVLITDFVEMQPFPDDTVTRIAPVLRTLHALPDFPKVVNYLESMDGFVKGLRAGNLLPEAGALFDAYDAIMEVYPRGEDEWVACHNDLKPQNIRFDGERMWLVDWEAAFLNDRYVDLAVVANFFVKNEADEDTFLSAYFGEPASHYQQARFFLMWQVMHMIYAAFMIMMAARGGTAIDADMSAPDLRAFHDGLLAGELVAGDGVTQVQYAKVHLNEMRRQVESARFGEALAVVREGIVSA